MARGAWEEQGTGARCCVARIPLAAQWWLTLPCPSHIRPALRSKPPGLHNATSCPAHSLQAAIFRTVEAGGQFVLLGSGHSDPVFRQLADGQFRDHPNCRCGVFRAVRVRHGSWSGARAINPCQRSGGVVRGVAGPPQGCGTVRGGWADVPLDVQDGPQGRWLGTWDADTYWQPAARRYRTRRVCVQPASPDASPPRAPCIQRASPPPRALSTAGHHVQSVPVYSAAVSPPHASPLPRALPTRLLIMYSERLAHQIYGAADVVVVPSMFEPCGLTQMIALRYGAVPVVRRWGGRAAGRGRGGGGGGTGRALGGTATGVWAQARVGQVRAARGRGRGTHPRHAGGCQRASRLQVVHVPMRRTFLRAVPSCMHVPHRRPAPSRTLLSRAPPPPRRPQDRRPGRHRQRRGARQRQRPAQRLHVRRRRRRLAARRAGPGAAAVQGAAGQVGRQGRGMRVFGTG